MIRASNRDIIIAHKEDLKDDKKFLDNAPNQVTLADLNDDVRSTIPTADIIIYEDSAKVKSIVLFNNSMEEDIYANPEEILSEADNVK